MTLINDELLDQVSKEAKESPRLRMNYNLHSSLDSKVQRLLNGLEPGTILPIHRHVDTEETYILLRGRINIMFYDSDKNMTNEFILDPLNGSYGVNIPQGQWHTLEVLESDSMIFEVKEGPYKPFDKNDVLDVSRT